MQASRIHWTETEVSTVVSAAAPLLKGVLATSVPEATLREVITIAQSVLPEDRQRSEKGLHHFVMRNKSPIAIMVENLQVQANPTQENPVIVSEVSSVAAVSGSAVEVSEGVSSPATSEVKEASVTNTRNIVRWSKTEYDKVLKEMAKILKENPHLEDKYSTILKLAQNAVLPKERRKSDKGVYQFIFGSKPEIDEKVKTYVYALNNGENLDDAENEDAETPASEMVAEQSEATEVSVVVSSSLGDVIHNAVDKVASNMHVPSDEILGLNIDALNEGMHRLADIVAMGFRNILTAKVEAVVSTIPQFIEPRVEAIIGNSIQDSMAKVEPKLIAMVKNQEPIRKKVLVVGPQAPQQEAIVRELGGVFTFKFLSSSEDPKLIKGLMNSADHVVAMVDKISHKHSDMFRNHPSKHLVTGGTSSVIAKLQDIYINS